MTESSNAGVGVSESASASDAGPRRAWWALAPVFAAVLALAAHWMLLELDHAQRMEQAEAKVQLRASQLAQSVGMQMGMLVEDVDYMAQALAAQWTAADPGAAIEVMQSMSAVLRPGLLVQATVADREGYIRFGSLVEGGVPDPPIYVGDREHFIAHTESPARDLHVSTPLKGRLSRQWSVFFSRPVLREGRFDGVAYVGVSPQYVSAMLHQILPDPRDEVMLVRKDGAYLARSHNFAEVAGQTAGDEHGFMRHPEQLAGVGRAVSAIDGIDRFEAFYRLENYPIVVSVGLDAAGALAETHASIRASHIENGIGSILFLLAMLFVARATLQRQRASAALAESRGQLALALEGGDLATWDWDVPSGIVRVNERWATLRGFAPDVRSFEVSSWESEVHPDDLPAVRAALQQHLDGRSAQFESEYRMRHHDGGWVWVLDRGRVLQRLPDGSPRRVVGTHLDVTPRHHAEELEREAGERLAKLVSQVPGVVYQFMLRPDGTWSFPYASAGIRNVYDLAAKDVVASADPVFARIHPDDVQRVSDSILASAKSLQMWTCEYRVRDPDGAERWLLGQANPERLEDGSVLWHGYIRDVTEQHHAAVALEQNEQRLRLTLEAVREGLWEWDIMTGEMRWDAHCFEILGYSEEAFEPSFDVWQGMVHPTDRRRVMVYLRDLFAGDQAQLARQEVRVRHADGKWKWVELRGRIVAWEGERPVRMLGTIIDIDERVAERQLRDVLLERSAAAIFIASPQRRLISANQRARALFGLSDTDGGDFDLRGIHVDEAHYLGFTKHIETLGADGEVRVEYPLRSVTGERLWFDMHGVVRDREREDSELIWTLIDVTDRHRAEVELKSERLRLITLLARYPGGVLMEDADGRVTVANRGLCELFGLHAEPRELMGLTHAALVERLGPERSGWLPEPDQVAGSEHRRSIEVGTHDGRQFEVDWVPIALGAERLGQAWFVRDVTERKQHEAELRSLATTDGLTGLPNRRSFLERLERAMADAQRLPSGGGAVLMLDIDHFKRVNDTWGHGVGDEVLQHFAEVVRNGLRSGDVAGRLGGEEFAVMLPATTMEDARALAERLREQIAAAPATTAAGEVRITVSIGIAGFDGDTPERMLTRADEALYEAKRSGRNRVCVADSADSAP